LPRLKLLILGPYRTKVQKYVQNGIFPKIFH